MKTKSNSKVKSIKSKSQVKGDMPTYREMQQILKGARANGFTCRYHLNCNADRISEMYREYMNIQRLEDKYYQEHETVEETVIEQPIVEQSIETLTNEIVELVVDMKEKIEQPTTNDDDDNTPNVTPLNSVDVYHIIKQHRHINDNFIPVHMIAKAMKLDHAKDFNRFWVALRILQRNDLIEMSSLSDVSNFSNDELRWMWGSSIGGGDFFIIIN